MNEFPEFRFVCSSASVFQWIEEFAPEMLNQIKERVREKRFTIVGGWHVQPDCNLPSGEAFARQSLYAQRYFQETFGVTATIGYCVDSFGHCATLPMILKHSGMDSYIFMRPSPEEKDLDSDFFEWIAPNGSSVTAYRILDPYCAKFDTPEALEARIAYLEETTKTQLPVLPLFYGVGNHGGGPTIRHLELLREYAKTHPDKELIHSDLRDFFDHIHSTQLPIPSYTGDLQHHASGCYAAEPRVKAGIRRAESDLIAAESYGVLASALCGKRAKNDRFHKAWDAVCFCHFHDSMGGCSIKEAHDDTLDMLGMAKYTAAVEENNALQTISWNIDTHHRALGQPLVVFNPHCFAVTQTVQVNGNFNTVRDAAGNAVPCQAVLSSSQECYARPDTLFQATVPPLGYRVYYLSNSAEAPQYESAVLATAQACPPDAVHVYGPVLENEHYRIQFECYSGYIVSFIDKHTGKELIRGRAAVPTVFDEFYHDTWSHGKNFFNDEMARFSDATLTVLENGPVRSTVKVVSRYNASVLTQYFSLEAGCPKLQVRAQIDWHEKHKLLKLAWPMNVEDPEAYYEIPFGVIQRPCDGEEEPGINWTAIKGTDGGFALLNNSTYSSSVNGNTLYQTVVRSPIFGDHGRSRTSESDYTAQGKTDFQYAIMPISGSWSQVVKAGRVLNKGLTNILDTWHEGHLDHDAISGLSVTVPNVVVSAVKRSEDHTGTVLRLYETDGKETDFTASGCALPCALNGHIAPWAVQTWYCKDGSEDWQAVQFTEYQNLF
jgi:alpha-mannosidase